MALSDDLISQFVKITKDTEPVKKETTVYGTIVESEGVKYVHLDGAPENTLTPAISSVETSVGDKVSVLLKNHTATITGNLTSPAVRTETVQIVVNTVKEAETILAKTVSTDQLNAEKARISKLETDYVTVNGNISANTAEIEKLQASNVDISGRLTTTEAIIKNLEVGNLDSETLRATYATIDFANITKVAMQNFYANSGLIQDVVIGDSTITGKLVGVTISGDLIEANTLVANKLVIQGENGLYYKLNTDGAKTEAEQTDQNSLDGTVIKAKSITASKISVTDLVAFGATIGGFKLTENSLYSGVKETIDNTTAGIYLDNDGQAYFGDGTNYLRYYKDATGTYKLDISANAITFGVSNTDLATAILNAGKSATDYMSLTSDGLVVGQNPSSPTAGNTLITSSGIKIRSGTTVLASFSAITARRNVITSATLTSTDSEDSESDGVTRVSGTVTKGETRSLVEIDTSANPVFFPKGIETRDVIINNNSGAIFNTNILLTASLVDKTGEGILTPRNSYGNMVIGYGRYQDGGGTYVYGTLVKAKTKNGFSASVNGVSALDTNNSSGNATFGWHLYEANKGETNIYGKITSLFAKDDIRLNASGNTVHLNGALVPYEADKFNIGTANSPFRNIYISLVNDGTQRGLRFSNNNGTAYNAVGVNAYGYPIFGNTTYCTNIICKSTTTDSTGYSFKITCGDNPALVLGDNDARLLLFGGTDATSRYIGSVAAYKRTYTSSGNMVITDNSIIGRATSSSRRYKKDIVDLDINIVKSLYDMPVRQFKYRDGYISDTDERYGKDIPGFIAEEVAEYLPIACDHIKDQNGDIVPEMWNSQIMIPALLKLIQNLNERVNELEEKEM